MSGLPLCPHRWCSIVKVANEVWRSYEMGHKPALILNLRLPHGSYDVNITPDKREVLLVHGEFQRMVAGCSPRSSTYQLSQLTRPPDCSGLHLFGSQDGAACPVGAQSAHLQGRQRRRDGAGTREHWHKRRPRRRNAAVSLFATAGAAVGCIAGVARPVAGACLASVNVIASIEAGESSCGRCGVCSIVRL